MTYRFLRLERGDDGVSHLLLNRPPLNVLHIPMLEEMADALDVIGADGSLKALQISGADRAFCAGVDVGDHAADRVVHMLTLFHKVVARVMALEFPVVAAVHGAALGGGCELMMACDLAVARADSRIGQPEIQLAVFPPVAAALLPRLIGRQHAMELILTGRVLTATEARERGLVSEVWPAEGWEERVREYMARFAALSGPVLRLTKRAVEGGFYLDPEDAMQRAESLYLNELMRLRDPHEGLAAFIDKRRPVWQEA